MAGVEPATITMIATGDPMEVLFHLNRACNMANTRSMRVMANDVVRVAKQNLEDGGHVKTGKLRDSIVSQSGGRASNEFTVSAGNSEVDYATYVEYGTSKMPPYPYLRPAIEQVVTPQAFADAIWNDPELKIAMHRTTISQLGAPGVFNRTRSSRMSSSDIQGKMSALGTANFEKPGSFTGNFGFSNTISTSSVNPLYGGS